MVTFSGCNSIKVTKYYENGVLATSAPIATEIGKKVFTEGGNAFDVAVAVGFVLAVVHPEAGNIGGGGFALIRDGKTGDIRALDFRETAPSLSHEKMYLDSLGEVIGNLSLFGAKAVGVPGTVAGLYKLWREYGTMSWDELVGIAAALADTGFIVDEYLAHSMEMHRESLTAFSESSAIFFPEGKSCRAGDLFVQKKLAKTLYIIAAEGQDGFYKGQVADSIVQCMQDYGGLITREDLESYRAIWRQPIKFEFDSLEIYSMPLPSSGGILIGQILKILEPFDLSLLTPSSPEYIHLFCEAAKLAFADRSEYLGDPDYYTVPNKTLLSNIYIENRRRLIDKEHASSSDDIKPGFIPTGESEQTTHFSVSDKDGNMVAVTYTLNTSYGSKLMVNGCGFLLNNEMDDFSIKAGVPNAYGLIGGEANKIEPSKRMLSSMSPTIILKEEKPFLILGTPGGSKIITVVAQAILNIVRFNLTLSEAARQPRFHHQWLPDILYLEEGGFDINVKQELIRYGHNIKERSAYSDLQMLLIEEPGGLMTGVSDPRNRGLCGGY